MTQTSDDLLAPFPLFQGPIAHAADTVGEARCWFCHRKRFCLELSIGHDVIAPCSFCGAITDLSADASRQPCAACGRSCSLDVPVEGEPACLSCLADGRFAVTKDSDVGMVRWRDAVAGLTHGLPVPPAEDGSPVTSYIGFRAGPPTAGGWQRIHVASELLLPLVLTPDFDSIQGSVWKFHCGRPMVFVGRWGRSDFERHAPDGDGAAFALSVADMETEAFDDLADSGDDEDAVVWAYGFRCTVCAAVAASWDVD